MNMIPEVLHYLQESFPGIYTEENSNIYFQYSSDSPKVEFLQSAFFELHLHSRLDSVLSIISNIWPTKAHRCCHSDWRFWALRRSRSLKRILHNITPPNQVDKYSISAQLNLQCPGPMEWMQVVTHDNRLDLFMDHRSDLSLYPDPVHNTYNFRGYPIHKMSPEDPGWSLLLQEAQDIILKEWVDNPIIYQFFKREVQKLLDTNNNVRQN